MIGRRNAPRSVRETIKTLETTLKILDSLKPLSPGAKPYRDLSKNGRLTDPYQEELKKCGKVEEYLREGMLREKNDIHMLKPCSNLPGDFTNMLVVEPYWLDHFKKSLKASLDELKRKGNKYDENKLSRAVRMYMRLQCEWD
jgi:hypothetical protein